MNGHRHDDMDDMDTCTSPVRAVFKGTLAVAHQRLIVDEIIIDTPEGLRDMLLHELPEAGSDHQQ